MILGAFGMCSRIAEGNKKREGRGKKHANPYVDCKVDAPKPTLKLATQRKINRTPNPPSKNNPKNPEEGNALPPVTNPLPAKRNHVLEDPSGPRNSPYSHLKTDSRAATNNTSPLAFAPGLVMSPAATPHAAGSGSCWCLPSPAAQAPSPGRSPLDAVQRRSRCGLLSRHPWRLSKPAHCRGHDPVSMGSSGALTTLAAVSAADADAYSKQLKEEAGRKEALHGVETSIRDVYEALCPQPEEVASRQRVVRKLERLIRQWHRDARLTLFGSSCNGFGFVGSDLDACLTFGRSKDGKDINHKKMLKAVAKKLGKRSKVLENVTALTRPRVPIIKCLHVPSGLDVDICVHNTLALQNTRLLKAYGDIDIRVRQLGYYLKYLAKTKGIGDASKGGLSSYAYLLMAVFYLQQCRPPVVPVLQELSPEGEARPEVLVEGWNTWFFDDISRLKQVWTGVGQNKWSVAELWLGMLRFYTFEFSFNEHVVSIRQKAPMTKSEKMWTCCSIAVEDPFKLDHNLGKGVNPMKKAEISCAFSCGLEEYFKEIHELPEAWPKDVDHSDSWPVTDDGPSSCGWDPCINGYGPHTEDCPQSKAS
ncbi:terminal uridylyltransferase 7-like [Haemaphysalis longicornis]